MPHEAPQARKVDTRTTISAAATPSTIGTSTPHLLVFFFKRTPLPVESPGRHAADGRGRHL